MVPLLVLVALIISGMSVQLSAFYSIIVTLIVGFMKNRRNMTVGNILGACENSVKSIAPVAAACILAGIIMGSMSLTGFGLKISSLIENDIRRKFIVCTIAFHGSQPSVWYGTSDIGGIYGIGGIGLLRYY